MRLNKVVTDYLSSYDYKNLRDNTKKRYKYFLDILCATQVGDDVLGKVSVKSMTTKQCKDAYNQWCDNSVGTANGILAISRLLFNHALREEFCMMNPFTVVRKRATERRKVVWSKEDVTKLLDAAYSDFSTRNIGLIAHMAYEWCQRVGDMRLLTWDAIDFEQRRVLIQQSKRNAEVQLPIEDDLYGMLVQQQDDFGFQQYIAPRPKPRNGVYEPYTLYKLPLYARKLMDDAGLSSELRLSDLRRTGTTEMVEAGVGIGQIMSVTGHANPQSVKPYLKNTYASANLALTARKKA
jgi:integrase